MSTIETDGHAPAPAVATPGDATGTDRKALLRQMIRIRRFEERCVQLYSAERIR